MRLHKWNPAPTIPSANAKASDNVPKKKARASIQNEWSSTPGMKA